MMTATDIKKLLKNTTPMTMEKVKSIVRDEILEHLGMMELDRWFWVCDIIDDTLNKFVDANGHLEKGEIMSIMQCYVGRLEKIVRERMKKQ